MPAEAPSRQAGMTVRWEKVSFEHQVALDHSELQPSQIGNTLAKPNSMLPVTASE